MHRQHFPFAFLLTHCWQATDVGSRKGSRIRIWPVIVLCWVIFWREKNRKIVFRFFELENSRSFIFWVLMYIFSCAYVILNKRVCPSVDPSIGQSVTLSLGGQNTYVVYMKFQIFAFASILHRNKQVLWDNDVCEVDILGHFGTFWDILRHFGT